MSTETLEEAANRMYAPNLNCQGEDSEYYERAAFVNGANWQAAKMYSEEETIQKIIDYVEFQFNTNGELNTEIKKWFEQFSKLKNG